MKKIVGALTLVVVIGLSFWFLRQNTTTQELSQKPKVAATIFPIYDITRQIAGEELQVELILPPGASPHTFDASPDDLTKMTGADAVFMVGHGLDDWSTDLAASAGVENMIAVDKNIELADFPESDHGHDDEHEGDSHDDENDTDGHAHEGTDPHYWLSASNGIAIAAQVRDELTALYPEEADTFASNYEAFEADVLAVQDELIAVFEEKQRNEFATFHNAWNYFARDFRLEIVTTFEEYPGESPSPEYLREFTEKVEEYDLNTVYSEPQLSTNVLDPIAQDLGVVIMEIDPIGGSDGLATYPDLLRYNGLQISKSL